MAQPTNLRNGNLNERSRLLNNQVHNEIQFHETSYVRVDSDSSSVLQYQPSEENYYRNSCKRLPRGKGVVLVFFLYFIETFALYTILNGLQQILLGDKPGSVWIFTIIEGTAGRIMYPVAGILADAYLGRYQVIHIGLWLMWIGFGLLAMSHALISLSSGIAFHYILPILAAIVISLGAGGVEVNTISFGVDQLEQGVTSEEISSY